MLLTTRVNCCNLSANWCPCVLLPFPCELLQCPCVQDLNIFCVSYVCNTMATRSNYILDYHDLCVKRWIKYIAGSQMDQGRRQGAGRGLAPPMVPKFTLNIWLLIKFLYKLAWLPPLIMKKINSWLRPWNGRSVVQTVYLAVYVYQIDNSCLDCCTYPDEVSFNTSFIES